MSFAGTVGQFNLAGATGNQSINTVGFQPKALILFGGRVTATGNTTAFVYNSGIAASSSQRAATSCAVNNNVATTFTRKAHSNVNVIYSINASGVVADQADFVSFDATGFTINASTTSTVIYSYLALGGTDMTNAAVIQLTTPASTGSQSYTGVGFMPDLVYLISTASSTAPPASNSNANFCIGAFDKRLNQASTSIFSNNNVTPSNSSRWQRLGSAFNVVGISEAESYRFTATSMDPDGFTVNWNTTAGSGVYVWALCIKGGSATVGNFLKKTSTGSQYIETGNLPDSLQFISAFNTASTTPSATSRLSLGATSGTSAEQGYSCIDVDASNPSSTNRRFTNTAMITSLDSTSTQVGEAELTSFDEHSAATPGGGATINWTTANATAQEIWYISLGAPSGPKLLTTLGVGT